MFSIECLTVRLIEYLFKFIHIFGYVFFENGYAEHMRILYSIDDRPIRLPFVACAHILLKKSLPSQNISWPSNQGSFCSILSSSFNGNSLIGLAILRNPRLRAATNYLIFTLLATDSVVMLGKSNFTKKI